MVHDGGVLALVHCSGLPGPAFVIPPPRPHLPGSGGAQEAKEVTDKRGEVAGSNSSSCRRFTNDIAVYGFLCSD